MREIDTLHDSLEEIEFLARSPNSVTVLNALASGVETTL
jgi:hypothetical protein